MGPPPVSGLRLGAGRVGVAVGSGVWLGRGVDGPLGRAVGEGEGAVLWLGVGEGEAGAVGRGAGESACAAAEHRAVSARAATRAAAPDGA
ncbi:hypothetical protein B1H19_22350 [Streptomyces gilvosporeus]|uniref:Uncharacterized protein n=1 Tax=Streptomyces gilvosporeus TaxID=553510 RepID=A0A1V0TUB7_9ACTN|nr:hypothetical protein B1H19_22350 [Streptomyces gilvosporeus]